MSEETFRILIVDDEPNIRSGLALALEEESYAIATAATPRRPGNCSGARPISSSSPT